jgi:spermidine synthase
MPGVDEVEVLGHAVSDRGEVLLRRRDDGGTVVEELVVNGTFAMDSTETHSERELGRLAGGAPRVLVGGLGLGCTVAAVLDEADRLALDVRVDVVELEPALVAWAHEGRTPTLARAATDPRVHLHVGDVAEVLTGALRQAQGTPAARGTPGPEGPWDAVLLDVDNGPDFLIHTANEGLYAAPTLRAAYERLAPGGVLAIWCQAPSLPLLAALRTILPSAHEDLHRVSREGRAFTYAIEVLRRPPT